MPITFVMTRTCALLIGLLALSSASMGARPAAGDEQIARVFADLEAGTQPGCAVGVMRDGALIHASGHGYADLERRTPITSKTVFNIASTSKQFTAFSLLLLEAQGKLSLDDSIVKHVPELGAYARPVTLRHLLHHTGGLRDYERLLYMRGRTMTDSVTKQETLDVLARQRAPNSAPGSEYSYSNTGYFLLGIVVDRVSGSSLASFAQRHIFQPAGMGSTVIVERYPANIDALARGYSESSVQPGRFEIDESLWQQTGDGQVHATVEDLLRWTENFHTANVGGADLIRRMLDRGKLASGATVDYAAGLRVGQYRGLNVVHHTGGWAGYRGQLLRFPDQHFAVSVLCNRFDGEPDVRAKAVAEIFLGDRMQPLAKPAQPLANDGAGQRPANAPAVRSNVADLDRYLGAFYSDEAEVTQRLVLRDNRLTLDTGSSRVPLDVGKVGQFFGPRELQIVFPAAGAADTLELTLWGVRNLEFVRVGESGVRERPVTLDTHLDTPRNFDRPGWKIRDRHNLRNDFSQVDYPRMVDGGLDGGFWAIFTLQRELTPSGYESARDFALKRAALIRRMVTENPEHFELATEADDARRIVEQGKRVVFMSIENAYPLGTEIEALRTFHSLGVRMIGPVHSADNQFADSATDKKRTWGGLSPLGLKLVAEANRLGMVIDASHASNDAFDQMLARSRAPIILSHSGCSAVYDHPRNIDDERLRRLAAAGGVIQINSLGAYLRSLPETPERDRELQPLRARFPSSDDMSVQQVKDYLSARLEIDARLPPARATLDDFMQHLLHAIRVAGIDHVGIGADWDGGGGVNGLEDVAKLPVISARLRAAGYSEEQVAKVMAGNTLRLLRQVQCVAQACTDQKKPER